MWPLVISKQRARATFLVLLLMMLTPACSKKAAEPNEATTEAEAGEKSENAAGTTVKLAEAAARNAGVRSEIVVAAATSGGAGFQAPGQVAFDPARVAMVSSRTAGRIERLAAVEGSRVSAGQPIAYLLSPAFLSAQNDYAQAFRRSRALEGSADADGARALLSGARRRLQLMGAPASALSRIEDGQPPIDLLPIGAPFAGSIIETLSLAGSAVEAGTPIFKIADMSVVNVVAEVPERLLPVLREGQAATVRVTAYPELQFTGRVSRIREELDVESRTAKAVIIVPNGNHKLRAGMFATVELAGVPGATPAASSITIPASAVVMDGSERFVFIETAPLTFERREVDLGPKEGNRVRIVSGITAGERVVVAGAFTLKAELGKAEFGEKE